MAASSTAAAFVVALKAALTQRFAAHGTLAAVQVSLKPTADSSQIDEVVLLAGTVTGVQEYAAMGNQRSDSYEIPGRLNTYATGMTDAALQESWDKAALILDEVILQLRDTPTLTGNQLSKGRVTDIVYAHLPLDKGGWVTKCDYTIEYGSLVA